MKIFNSILFRRFYRTLSITKLCQYGILLLLAAMCLTGVSARLYTQDCTYTGGIDIQYYKVNSEGHRELVDELFLVLGYQGREREDSIFLYADLGDHDLEWEDPDVSTPHGIRFFIP